MNVVELINQLQNTLNKLINKNDLRVKTTELLNELLETLEAIENCKDKKIDGFDLDEFHKSIDGIESCLARLEKGRKKDNTIYYLKKELFKINIGLNKEILCEDCKEKEIEQLIDKCGNEEIARFLYDCKLYANDYFNYTVINISDGFHLISLEMSNTWPKADLEKFIKKLGLMAIITYRKRNIKITKLY